MPLIKRYPNRKLYDTEAKQYITLEGIADLIRQGEQVAVVDHATGEDLTTVTLSQVIFEQEKKHSGFLPLSVLTGLIQSGGETVSSLRRTLASPLGLLRHTEEEIEWRVRALISRGELDEKEGLHLLDKLLSLGHPTEQRQWPDEEDLQRVMIERGVPTHDDLQKIVDQLDALAEKLEELDQDKKAT